MRNFSPEGQRIFDNILKYDELKNKTKNGVPPPPIKKMSKEAIDLNNIRLELVKLIVNSQMVVDDCNEILENIVDMDEYLKCDAKVAKTVHENQITRLERVIAGLPAFENEDHLTEDIDKLKNALTKG